MCLVARVACLACVWLSRPAIPTTIKSMTKGRYCLDYIVYKYRVKSNCGSAGYGGSHTSFIAVVELLEALCKGLALQLKRIYFRLRCQVGHLELQIVADELCPF